MRLRARLQRSIRAAWGALVAIDLLSRATWLAPRLATTRGALNYGAAVIALLLVLRLLAMAPRRRRVWLFAVFVSVPMAIQFAVFRAYGQFVEPTDFVAFFESPRVVLFAAWSGADRLGMIAVFVVSLATAWIMPKEKRPLRVWWIGLAGATLATAFGIGATYWRASPSLAHAQPAFLSAAVGLLPRTTIRARQGRRVVVPPAPANEPLPNIVLVVGESLAASHLTLYGYERDTTPRLQKIADRGEAIVMRDAVVVGPHTRTSVPYILTGLEGPDPDGRVFGAPTILAYAKARGYHTAFVSAQEESWGSLDALFREGADIFRTGIQFAPDVDVLKGADDLVVLEKGVLPALDTLREPFFLVVHMDGSHIPYGHHSPASHKVFVPEEGVNSIRAYDNSVRVTDEFLARTFDKLHARDPNAWMFFTSDHGQALGEGGAFFNRGYQLNVVRDPLLVFLPKDTDRAPWHALSPAQVSACDVAPTILHLMKTAPAPSAPMDCANWLDGPPVARVRVVSAYTPTYVTEPTMLVVLPDGARRVYHLGQGNVTLDDGSILPIGDRPLPDRVAARLR